VAWEVDRARLASLLLAIALVATVGCGGGAGSSTNTSSTSNPVPALTSLSPASATADSAAFTLTVNGTGFISASQVQWNGSARTTQFVSSSQLTASITAADVQTASSATVTVSNPAPGGGTSNGLVFAINGPASTITSISPTSVGANTPGFQLTVNGTGFTSSSTVSINSTTPLQTQLVSSTQLTAIVPSSELTTVETATISVSDSAGSENLDILGPVTIVQDSALRITGLASPIRIAFAPDGALLVAEQTGVIKRVTISNGVGTVATWASFTVNQSDPSYLGLLGMALDPADPPTASGGDVYVFYTGTTSGSPDNRIARITYGGTTPVTPVDLVTGLPVAASPDQLWLNGGKVAVQSVDGIDYVYASTGGSDESPELSQNASSLYGKILRFETSANPPVSPSVFACGFRNSFGFDFHPSTGALYAMDNGNEGVAPSGETTPPFFSWYDSLDRVIMGGDEGYGFSSSAQCQSTLTPPLWQNTGSLAIARAPAAAIFYTHQEIPQLQNSLLVVGNLLADVYQFAVDEYGTAPGTLLTTPAAVTGATLPSTVFGATDLAQGPDGCIYVNTQLDTNATPLYIYRFMPQGGKCM